MLIPSTFSIVGFDPDEQAWGVAVASKFLAVGSVVPWARSGAGAVATQSYANTTFGPQGLGLLEKGLAAEEVIQELLADDPQAELRQVGIVDAQGGAATFTGKSCYDWAGGVTGPGFTVQGNILVGAVVIESMASAFIASSGNLIWRLYRALQAGDEAGGDRRGRQSAAIYVVKPGGGYAGFNDRWVDLRVDDHPEPVKRLGELIELRDLYFGKSPVGEQVQLEGDTLRQVQKLMSRMGYYQGPLSGEYDKTTRKAFEAFLGNENFEDRADFQAGRIDSPVLAYLLKHYSGER